MSLGTNINLTHRDSHGDLNEYPLVNGNLGLPTKHRIPNNITNISNSSQLGHPADGELGTDEDPRVALFKGLYAQSEARIKALFDEEGDSQGIISEEEEVQAARPKVGAPQAEWSQKAGLPQKPARNIDEDDYDDDDDDDEEGADPNTASPLHSKNNTTQVIPNHVLSPHKRKAIPSPAPSKVKYAKVQGKTLEEVRKRLEEDKKATEDAAKRSFHTQFHTLENDRDTMLEQQKLEESDRQVDVELSGHGHAGNVNHAAAGVTQQGTLSQANLGASSLTLKHLIARIDAKREKVQASDAELRTLMSEVRKNRSKWASEDRMGQEELYEAAEKVLSELKAMTEHSNAFLTKVNRREAPDYYNIIKQPMDLGSMTKKLKAVVYKSKQEFVDDLNLIWANCLKYNANPDHFLRRHALYMRKETEKLVPLIPEIVIRDRADVEAEERRLQVGDGDLDGGEESDDEPIISSRGRKAPGKKAKKGTNARKAPSGATEETPAPESKPAAHAIAPGGFNDKINLLKAESEAGIDGSQTGLSSPPPGTITPAGVNGVPGTGAPGSQADIMEIDGMGSSVNGAGAGHRLGSPIVETDHDDLEYKTWKQVTKKDRALVAAERHRLFKSDHLNGDEPALLRTKAGMRRWMRQQKQAIADGVMGDQKAMFDADREEETQKTGETLAEGMEGEEERVLPDYYDTVAAIPEIPRRLRWIEDAEGQVQDPSEEFLRTVPKGYFTSPESALTNKMDANMRQMQETRKVCTKIGVVKQMQLQSQMYQNQFQRYDPEPFVDQDIEPHVMSDDGPVMSPWVCRATLQRAVGKICYHAGFEEFQPSALDALTDIAGDFFTKLSRSLATFMQVPKAARPAAAAEPSDETLDVKANKFSTEETILHCLHENGVDVESLESYIKDDVERLSGKLGVMHDRMKAHLADLLRPALNDAGPDGVNAFNDGSEQFVGGDFAEDLDEDFFGFKELGLDKEFGLASLSVPLHLLQNRMHNAYQAQNTSTTSSLPTSLTPPPAFAPLTIDHLKQQIGLVQNFFLAKLHANNDEALIEDDDLPQKQRFPKPRLPPTGKISSPRKRPIREPGPGKGHARKKMKMTEEDGGGTNVNGNGSGSGSGGGGGAKDTAVSAATVAKLGKPVGKLKLGAVAMERSGQREDNGSSGCKDGMSETRVGGDPEKKDVEPEKKKKQQCEPEEGKKKEVGVEGSDDVSAATTTTAATAATAVTAVDKEAKTTVATAAAKGETGALVSPPESLEAT